MKENGIDATQTLATHSNFFESDFLIDMLKYYSPTVMHDKLFFATFASCTVYLQDAKVVNKKLDHVLRCVNKTLAKQSWYRHLYRQLNVRP